MGGQHPYFDGCMPIEVMAERGEDTLRFGPMKPVGLDDPRTGRWPYAVVQLRQDNKLGTLFNMVGFQTKLKYAEQTRVFRMIPAWKMPNLRGWAVCTVTRSSIRRPCWTANCA
jgi:tRNA:m(5)U-54 methyltransferase